MSSVLGVARPTRVLMVYDRLDVPSTTVRALQFRQRFTASDQFDVRFVGRTSESINRVMRHWPNRAGLKAPMTFVEKKVQQRRDASIVEMAREVDVVMMMTVPSWSLHQSLCDLPQTRLVTDLIDALWLPCFRDHGWAHIDEMLSSSDAVICENQYTAKYTLGRNANVFVIPDAPQVDVFDRYRSSVCKDPSCLTIGWVGGKYTADALYQIYEALEQTFAKHDNLQLRLVGADPDRLPRFAKTRYSVRSNYNQETMVREVLAMDIGIFPMFEIDESLYRGTLKTRIYMSGEAAVIGQNLGENKTLIRHDENGLLAGDTAQWCECLDQLITQPPRRHRLAAEGLKTIRAGYTVDHCFEMLTDAIHRTLQIKKA